MDISKDNCDDLLNKAQQIVDEKYQTKLLKSFLFDTYKIKQKHEVLFFMEFIKTGVAFSSYKTAYAPTMSDSVARTASSQLLKKRGVSFEDWLEYAGHGTDSITEALDVLKEKSPNDYLKHISTLKKLDVRRIEHSGGIAIRFEKDLDD